MKGVRSVTYAAILALLVAGSLPARGAGVSTQKLAFASWIVPTDNPDRALWFFAVGADDVHIGEDEYTFAVVGKGTCKRTIKPDMTRISCSGRSGTISNNARSFQMDTAAQEAAIKLREKGKTHTAHWSSGDVTDDGFYTSQMQCETGIGTGGGIARNADANARMFGRKLTKSRWFDFNIMFSGGFVDACGGAADLITDVAAGDNIRLDFVRR